MGIWYTTREAVKAATDSKSTARDDAQVDRAIESASRTVESLLNRVFYPWSGTRKLDYPNDRTARSGRLWLDQYELISLSAVTSGGVTIPTADILLQPQDGPPYTRLDIDLSTNLFWTSGNTYQRSVHLTGVFGGSNDTTPGGALAEALDDSETGVDITDASLIGVGDLLTVGSERMQVTGRASLTTGTTISGDLAASAAVRTVPVVSGPAVHAGERILIDSETMLVTDVTGNNLTVTRAYDGSVLAVHTTGATVYASRTLTVVRGVTGTTAATASNSAAITRQAYPGPVVTLTTALAVNTIRQELAAWSGTSGGGNNAQAVTGGGLDALIAQAKGTCGRTLRKRATR